VRPGAGLGHQARAHPVLHEPEGGRLRRPSGSACWICSTTTFGATEACITCCVGRTKWSDCSTTRRSSRPRRSRLRRRAPRFAPISSTFANERNKSYDVGWSYLKLNDRYQRTILCKDPFKPTDPRVEEMINSG